MHHKSPRRANRFGISMLELLAVVTIIGAIAAALVPRISGGAKASQAASCHVTCRVIEIQASLWRKETGSWPAATLSDIGESKNHFPEGKPVCPVDGSDYSINITSGRVIGHDH